MCELTKQEAAIITAINSYVDENECQPEIRDLTKILGQKYLSLCIDLMDMKCKGLIDWFEKDERSTLVWSTYER